jgi:hypothetical protein
MLKEVEIFGKVKEKLNYDKIPGNTIARGVKIEANNRFTLTQIIENNGFEVINSLGTTTIYRFTGGARIEPEVFINDLLINDLDIINSIFPTAIDEIYFNNDILITNTRNRKTIGWIKIYTKRDVEMFKNNDALKTITISGGFEIEKKFTNPYVNSTQNQAFKKYGTIEWIPNINTDADGNFEFKIPKLEQKKVFLNLQGIDSVGNVYYENIILQVK